MIKYPVGIAGLFCLLVAIVAKGLENRGAHVGNVFAISSYLAATLLLCVLPLLLWQERDSRRRLEEWRRGPASRPRARDDKDGIG
ncbi:hypothetical protein [Streptomyces sp. NBC_00470]|uniref:hypothetical protein n=1 Tax=Streptomyces sp. NBC_00470 TaxID=2975753 RepID=UPI002F91BEEE